MNNIDSDGKNLIVRTQNNLYVLEDEGFKEIRRIDLKDGRYTWIKSQGNMSRLATYNSDLIPPNKVLLVESQGELLPGQFHSNITKARIGDAFYINHKGNLLEYHINNFYFVAHRGKSVRYVYNDDSVRIISTYSGVFIDKDYKSFKSESLPGGDYSNGETFKINGRYYFCKDYLYQLKNNTWIKVPIPYKDPAFIKMREIGKRILYLSNYRVGYIDLRTATLNKTLYESSSQLNDIEILDDRILIASLDGNIYSIGLDGENVKKNPIGSPIYDINVEGEKALLSCQNGLYEYSSKTGSSKKIFDFNTAVQSINVNDKVIVATFDGLYIVNGGKVYNIIPKTEFNKYGLSTYGGEIYAGALEGLYVINKYQLLFDILPGLTPVVKIDITRDFFYWKISFVVILISLGMIVFYLQKSKHKLNVEVKKKTKITPESIREIMFSDEKLTTVESVADYFETSTVQLNRVLKKYNTSGLILMKEIKGEIIKDCVKLGMDFDSIAIRVGYSVKYLKKNFAESLSQK